VRKEYKSNGPREKTPIRRLSYENLAEMARKRRENEECRCSESESKEFTLVQKGLPSLNCCSTSSVSYLPSSNIIDVVTH